MDGPKTKNRPAVVLSSDRHFNSPAGHTLLAMITSALHSPWPLDFTISNLKSCGLEKASVIRFKLFTIDNRLIKEHIGKLSSKDQNSLQEVISLAFEELLFMH